MERHPFITTRYAHRIYRISTNEYIGNSNLVHISLLISLIISLMELSLLFSPILQLNTYAMVLWMGVLGCGYLCVYAVKNRNYVKVDWMLSLINLQLFIIGLVVIDLCGRTWYTYWICCYELSTSFGYITNGGIILSKLVILIEIMLMGLKVDHRITISWQDLLLLWLVVGMLLVVGLVMLSAYVIVTITCYYQQHTKYRYYGLGMVLLMMASISIHLISIYLCCMPGVITEILLIPCLILSLCSAVYTYIHQSHIIVWLSHLQQMRQFNRILSVVAIQDKAILNRTIYRMSQNWCTLSQPTFTSQKHIKDNIQQIDGRCLICLSDDPTVLWGNCGHLCVCQLCYYQILINKNIQCLLCKKNPQYILILQKLQQNKMMVKQGYWIRLC